MNLVILKGRIGSELETTTTTTGTTVCKFTLATNEQYQGKTTVQWHKIVAWTKLAEICKKYCSKGQEILIQGKIQNRTWEKDGKKHYATDIVIDRMEFVGKKGEQPAAEPDYNDIPF